MVEVQVRLSPGEEILLRRGSLQVEGVVAWCFEGKAGIKFREAIVVQSWSARQHGEGGQTQIDRVVAAANTGASEVEPAVKRAKNGLERDVLDSRLAEEILLVARIIEQLGEDIAEEPLMIARHGHSLQQLDVAVQTLGHIARIITADDPEAVLDEIGMKELVARLRRRSL
jgi:hypothetical protein